MIRGLALNLYERLYSSVIRPHLFKMTAQDAHEWALNQLTRTDDSFLAVKFAKLTQQLTFARQLTPVGKLQLKYPLILAAGFVKGMGFASEEEALKAVNQGINIIPGWHMMPSLVGLVEYGSFTRYPRLGNAGTVIWRHPEDMSTQNRFGLKNPGAVAAAEFLGQRLNKLPPQYGINIAISPSVDDESEEIADIQEAAMAFLSRNVYPTWFTLNVSCPNTEDDPSGHQTHGKTMRLVKALVEIVDPIPVWVKISPRLSEEQYVALIEATELAGGEAIIATNTLPMPAPNDPHLMAGVGGGCLYPYAIDTVKILMEKKQMLGAKIDIIACGGILSHEQYSAYSQLGVKAMQYWSALVYLGPLAAALISHKANRNI